MTDTIKSGTTPIEEDALLPEFLRFEGERGTLFRIVGGIIGGLWKARGKKARSTRAKATWLFLTLGVLLSSCLPSGAQTHSTQLSLMQQRPARRMIPLAASSRHMQPTSLLPARLPEQRPAPRMIPLAASSRHMQPTTLLPAGWPEPRPARFAVLLKHFSRVEVGETSIVRQARVTIVQLGGGRLQLGGFASTQHMENVLLGSSGLRPGEGVLHTNRSYGLSLTLWCLRWIVGAGCGSHL